MRYHGATSLGISSFIKWPTKMFFFSARKIKHLLKEMSDSVEASISKGFLVHQYENKCCFGTNGFICVLSTVSHFLTAAKRHKTLKIAFEFR